MITVATWNVLHRVHAENWGEDVVARWPEEAKRVAAITERVVGLAADVVALQEVSGDQLASLRDALVDRSVHAFEYPRVPNARRSPSPLQDNTEHLVVVARERVEAVRAEAFDTDLGKGALVVRLAGTLVVATHVSGDRRRVAQLRRLAALVPRARPSVLLGDFNTDRDTIAAIMGPAFTVAAPQAGALATRPRPCRPIPDIDHVVTHQLTASPATVEDADGLSDHNIVHAGVA